MLAEFVYEGKVRGQGRPRVRKGGWTYENPEDTAFKKAIAAAYKDQCGVWFGDRELSAVIYVERPLPKSRPKQITSEPDVFKPDGDNVAKAVFDALEGVAYKNDSQITDQRIIKRPRTRRVMFDRMTVIIEAVER